VHSSASTADLPLHAGYVLVDKPAGPSSHAAVQQVRRALGLGGRRGTRGGHAGTLDPFASGLLLVLLGRATRLMPFVVGHDKRYVVDVRFGAGSSTDDREGELRPDRRPAPTPEQVRDALAELSTSTEQVPPAVSALHVDGVRAYQRVRRGEVVEVPARPVRFDAIDLLDWRPAAPGETGPTAVLDVRCATGTYMRALARDLGELVACSAHCSELRRTEVGSLRVDGAPAPDAVTRADVRDPRDLLVDLPEHAIDTSELGDIAAGRRIALPGALRSAPHVALVAPDGALAAIARPTSDLALLQPTTVLVDPPAPGVRGSSA
jgi:tRNA pseudouridine55 synthase